MFQVNDENKEITEFHSENTNVYMNETSDNHLLVSPIKASCMSIKYRDYKGDIHEIEGITYMFVTDYKSK